MAERSPKKSKLVATGVAVLAIGGALFAGAHNNDNATKTTPIYTEEQVKKYENALKILKNNELTTAEVDTRQKYEREADFANDPENLIAVDGHENIIKGNGFQNAKSKLWVPTQNPGYICDYITERIKVKKKYNLHLIYDEKEKSEQELQTCLNNKIPSE
jgi:hypothetical protein